MKKLITVLITLSVALAITVGVMAFEANVPKVVQPGDVNADGSIDTKDIVLLAQYLAKWEVQLGGDSHTVVIDKAVEPTCKETGLTEGKHCSDCGMILVKQQVIPTTDHDYKDTVVPPTDTERGYTLHKCEDCGHELIDSFTNATLAKGLDYKIENGACTITGIGTCEETELYIPDTIENCNVTAIADKAFSEQTQLTKIGLPKYIQTLGVRAFYGCTGLTEFTVPASVTSIGHQVFYKCDNLATVYYNSSFSPAQDKVFLNIPSIKTAIFGGKTVPSNICYNCTNIEKVEVLDNVTSIGSYAFYNCNSLKKVYYGGDASDWSGISIDSSNYSLTSATRYYYSFTQPVESGNYWRYVDGVPTPW